MYQDNVPDYHREVADEHIIRGNLWVVCLSRPPRTGHQSRVCRALRALENPSLKSHPICDCIAISRNIHNNRAMKSQRYLVLSLVYKKNRRATVANQILFILPFCLFMLFGTTTFAQSREIPADEVVSFGGYIVTSDGVTIRVVEFLQPLRSYYIQGTYKGSTVRFKASDLLEVWLLDENCTYGWIYQKGRCKGTMRVTNRDSKTFTITECDFAAHNLEWGLSYVVYNEITGSAEETSIMTYDISRLSFSEDLGTIRQCPKCERIFPSDYLFCPYDSTELLWFEPGE